MKKIILLFLCAFMTFDLMAQMILEFNTNLSSGTSITLPLRGNFNATVDWGDSSTNTYISDEDPSHTYTSEGTYTVTITGNLDVFGFGWNSNENAGKLVRVISWDNLGLTSLYGAFRNETNLIEVPNSLPSTVSNINNIFEGCSAFNYNISGWNLNNITELKNVFKGATSFNQNIGTWNVSSIENTYYTFYGASAFNQDISSWNVSNVVNMYGMFYNATAFNQNISSWNVSNVTNMYNMFNGASSFNQDISSWNVSSVTNMNSMFDGASSFNQDISSWDVSNVRFMSYMFENASSFDQNLGDWNIINVTTMYKMFNRVTLSTENYDGILIGWAAKTVQNGVNFDAGNSMYSPVASAARAVLTGTYNWNITDDGTTLTGIIISTSSASKITATGAVCGGEITHDGGSPITARGVIWSTSEYPTVNNTMGITNDGSGTGSFISNITGLTTGSTYYVRAYAINANDTTYGESITITPQTKQLTLSGNFTANDKAYDGTSNASINTNNLSLNGIESWMNNVSIGTVSLQFNDKYIGNNKEVTIKNAQLTGTDADNYTLSITGAPSDSANITPKEITIGGSFFAEDKAYDGTTSANINTENLTLEGIVGTEDVALDNITAEFENPQVANNVVVKITNAQLTGTDADNYTLSITGAPTTTANITEETTYIHYPNKENSVNIYPNPFQNAINIDNLKDAQHIYITTVTGEILMNININEASNKNIYINAPNGLYIITIFQKDGSRITKRVIKK